MTECLDLIKLKMECCRMACNAAGTLDHDQCAADRWSIIIVSQDNISIIQRCNISRMHKACCTNKDLLQGTWHSSEMTSTVGTSLQHRSKIS